MKTSFLLMAQYDGLAVIPVAVVVRDYFSHLTPETFLRKAAMGDIRLPIVRTDPGTQKSARGVHLTDLAAYLDERRAAAIREAELIAGARR